MYDTQILTGYKLNRLIDVDHYSAVIFLHEDGFTAGFRTRDESKIFVYGKPEKGERWLFKQFRTAYEYISKKGFLNFEMLIELDQCQNRRWVVQQHEGESWS